MNYKEALNRAQNICSKQEKCIRDMEMKLNDWQVNEENREKIIQHLIAEKYIDEQRYAKSFVHDKLYISKWGKIKMKYHLKQKGLKDEDIENVFNELSMKDYFATLERLLKLKSQNLKADNSKTQYRKLIAYAYNRGFSFEESHEIIQRLIKNKWY